MHVGKNQSDRPHHPPAPPASHALLSREESDGIVLEQLKVKHAAAAAVRQPVGLRVAAARRPPAAHAQALPSRGERAQGSLSARHLPFGQPLGLLLAAEQSAASRVVSRPRGDSQRARLL